MHIFKSNNKGNTNYTTYLPKSSNQYHIKVGTVDKPQSQTTEHINVLIKTKMD